MTRRAPAKYEGIIRNLLLFLRTFVVTFFYAYVAIAVGIVLITLSSRYESMGLDAFRRDTLLELWNAYVHVAMFKHVAVCSVVSALVAFKYTLEK
jgi:hypothetical protein